MSNTGEPNTAREFRAGRSPRTVRAIPASRCLRRRANGWMALAAAVLAAGGLLHALPAPAAEFGEGAFRGSLDTTISQGLTFRVEERDGELAADINGNDGNLNYDTGLVSSASKFTTDLDIGFGDFGAFVRTTGFIDFENQNGKRARTPLSDEAKEQVGRDVEVLDAYVTATADTGGAVIDLRLGRHVLNWGESTFIPNGINAINPFDVSALRLPGSELREALLPVGLASVSVAPTDNLSLEAFYQLDWQETRIDAVGSYFSATDYAGPGARKAVISDVMEGLLPDHPELRDRGFGFGQPLTTLINCDLGAIPQLPMQLGGSACPASQGSPQRAQPAFDRDFASVLRGPDRAPRDSGQWGAALRYLAEDLNDTEFGLYFINYHSRLPTVGARTASLQAVQAGLAAAGAVGDPSSMTAAAITRQVTAEVQQAVQAGAIPPANAPAIVAQRVEEAVGGIAAGLAIDRYGKGGHYFLEYPEDIQLLGLSFNTVVGNTGWALQGEYSLRPNAPLQRAEREVLEDGLRPIITGLGLAGCAADPALPDCPKNPVTGQPLPAQVFQDRLNQHLASHAPSNVQGYVERNVSQIQATATRVFGPTLGADAMAIVAEAALMHVHDMPDRTEDPLESPAGGVLANGKADAHATSWGYRLAARLDYSNAIGAVNLYPYAQFLHDVQGNSPAPSGPFVEGRTALTLGLRADYLSSWQADLSYTRLAGEGNELADRDFLSLSVKYSF